MIIPSVQELVIRELRHRGARLIRDLLPPIDPEAQEALNDALLSFFKDNQGDIEAEFPPVVDRRHPELGPTRDNAAIDRAEITDLERMCHDLEMKGNTSDSFF